MAILSPGETIGIDAIPSEIRRHRENTPKSTVQEARESAEREHIEKALEASGWNVSSAARALGMERTNLHKRMRALGVSRER
jgi:two-component system nitrogen regulation response regulator NtrX